MRRAFPLLPAIFIASLCSLSYEITLMRIFSISLWYHFAFMVISIAMLGLAASGTILSLYPKLKDERRIGFYLLLFSAGMPLSYLLANQIPFDPAKLSWDTAQLFYITLYYLILSLPFFAFGLIVSAAFSNMSEKSGSIYGADLTGAGAGSVLTLLLLSAWSPEKAVFLISLISVIPLFFSERKGLRLISLLLLGLNLAVLFVHPSFMDIRISPYKPLETALKFPGAKLLETRHGPFSRVDIFDSPAARYAPGLSFRYLEELPEQTGIAVDAGDFYAVTTDKSRQDLRFIEYLPSSLPYEISPKSSVLVIEPKGGLPVLAAEFYGAGEIFKIDSDPLVIEAVKTFEGFSTDIYEDNTWTGLGRSRLFPGDKKFDLIDIWIMGSAPTGSFGFSEDHRFTVEAFEEYLRHLKDSGSISLSLFIVPPPRMELRLLSTLAAAAERQGIKDFGRHFAALRSWGTITMVFKKSVLTGEDAAAIREFSQERRFDPVYYPGIKETEANVFIEMQTNAYFEAFRSLVEPATRQSFIDGYLFDIEPVHDSAPFFHYYLKLGNIGEIYSLMGNKWHYFVREGYLLPLILLQVIFLGSLLVFLPAIRHRSLNRRETVSGSALFLFYFALLGLGFMFIELSFIQKMILPLENPSYAAAAVLASMLVSSGIGSLLSARFHKLRTPRVLVFLAIILLLYSLLPDQIMKFMYSYSLALKISLVFFVLMPAGMLMGIPFPMGLTLLGRKKPALIPWAWAVNGCLSVISPVLAVIIAISAGFDIIVLMGALVYLSAFFCLRAVEN
jgi:hypothetical protein